MARKSARCSKPLPETNNFPLVTGRMSNESDKKQAVVLIHGIGEQVPMDNLRQFAEVLWTKDDTVRQPWIPSHVWSKPDRMSGNFELRRLTTASNKEGRRTDFFEFYWADLMKDTKLSHLWAWIKVLLLRPPAQVPQALRSLWFLLWGVGVLVLLGFVGLKWKWWPAVDPILPWISTIGAIVWVAVSGFLINVVGDAARYFHVAPSNIASRRSIRQAGLALLRELHACNKYDRIVVVGHSLGSAIGYDILTHLWAEYHDAHQKNMPAEKSEARAKIETLAQAPGEEATYVKKFQEAQSGYHAELRHQGNPWVVTDFVTLGSPLAHAPLLLARDREQFDQKIADRELPTCPPALEKVEKRQRFTFPAKGSGWIPHHAAGFGPTRWTNLYFKSSRIVWGDFIAGPLRPVFGAGIRDVELRTRLRRGLFSHTLYWTLPTSQTKAPPAHITELRQAVRIVENR